GEGREYLQAIDDDDCWAMLFDQRVHPLEHTRQSVFMQRVAKIVVEHRAANSRGVEEVERLAVAQQLVQRLRNRRKIKARSFLRRVREQDLLRQNCLAGTWCAD